MRPPSLLRSLSFALVVAAAAPAAAAPDSLVALETEAGVVLTGLGADLDGSMSVAGFAIDSSTMFTPLRGRAFFGGLAGLSNVSGTLATEPSSAQTGGATDFGANVWIAQGDQVLQRTAAGWSSAPAPARLDALHAFDGDRLVGVGQGGTAGLSSDGGASWTAIPTGTDADLTGMFWRDDQTGWAWGGTIETTGGGFGDEDEQRAVDVGVLLRSDDAGGTWSLVTERPGTLIGPAFFLADGQRGWMATARIAAEGSGADAALWTTQDGGRSWSAVELPPVVGQLESPFSTDDVGLSFVRSMWWDNANQGRMFAVAHLFDAQSSGSGGSGGSTTSDAAGWKIVELVTNDGGKSWDYNDLGTTVVEFSFEGTTAEHDGAVSSGTALSWSRHALLGDNGRVWRTADWGNDPDHATDGGGGNSDGGEGGDGGSDGRGNNGRDVADGSAADSGCSASPLGGWTALSWLLALGLRRRR